MDRAAQVASGMNLQALKEPRGFLRCIQWILAIFAFATTTSGGSKSGFTYTCPGGDEEKKTLSWSYPFRLDTTKLVFNVCPGLFNATDFQESYTPYGNFQPPSEFFVFVGVMAFLYCMAALAIYIFMDEKYRQMELLPIVDFVTTAVFAALFLIASAAWAQNVTHLKYYSDPQTIIDHVKQCGIVKDLCKPQYYGNFASLNVSLIFGFLNMAVWGANLWFLFKETKWFKVQSMPPTTNMPPNQMPPSIDTHPPIPQQRI